PGNLKTQTLLNTRAVSGRKPERARPTAGRGTVRRRCVAPRGADLQQDPAEGTVQHVWRGVLSRRRTKKGSRERRDRGGGSAGRGFFVFQAADGIRDRNVTGVQTLLFPIWAASATSNSSASRTSRVTSSSSFSVAFWNHSRNSWALVMVKLLTRGVVRLRG